MDQFINCQNCGANIKKLNESKHKRKCTYYKNVDLFIKKGKVESRIKDFENESITEEIIKKVEIESAEEFADKWQKQIQENYIKNKVMTYNDNDYDYHYNINNNNK